MDIFSILEGFGNLGLKVFDAADNSVETIALNRFKICAKCPMKSPRNFCRKCGCFLPAKVRSLNDSCPIGNWDQLDLQILT
jgi:hypothetical protein